ncbi:MAK10-like protein [Tanacetum coccineum]
MHTRASNFELVEPLPEPEHTLNVDFMILDIKEDQKRPFLLGTPFLNTSKAVIKYDKGTITLRSVKNKISFHIMPKPLGKIKKGIKNNIEPIAPTMTVIFDEKKKPENCGEVLRKFQEDDS